MKTAFIDLVRASAAAITITGVAQGPREILAAANRGALLAARVGAPARLSAVKTSAPPNVTSIARENCGSWMIAM